MNTYKKIILTAVLAIAWGAFLAATPAAAADHDVEWTFGNAGSQSYTLQSFSPDSAGLGTVGGQDPTLNLQLGKRHQVTVVNFSFHPFEVIAKGASSSGDVVLLSMSAAVNGSFEADPAVNWENRGGGVVVFTFTPGLYNAMIASGRAPGYRCGIHTSTMRGNFSVSGAPLSDPIPETIEKGDERVELRTVATGLTAPLELKSAGEGSGRLFVVDQSGKVHLFKNGMLAGAPFLDASERLVPLGVSGTQAENDFDERGLLGLAFHPEFSDPQAPGFGKVYTYTSEPVSDEADFTTSPLSGGAAFDHQSVIAEWSVDSQNPDAVDPTTRREIMRIDQPAFNHNGGMIEFGPDGYLYIALGDGGGSNDVGEGHGVDGNGQDIGTVHGSILRIDPLAPVSGERRVDSVSANGRYRVPGDNPFINTGGVDEIYAHGFRNPYRFSFDSLDGGLIVADVGQDNIEEVNRVEAGRNYGWREKEGSFRFYPETGDVTDDTTGLPTDLEDPVLEYDHDEGLSVIGGHVYRGAALPGLAGKYVFGDFSTSFSTGAGRLFYGDPDSGVIRELVIGADDRDLNLYVKGFGADASGELYLLASSNLGPFGASGVVMKIVPATAEPLAAPTLAVTTEGSTATLSWSPSDGAAGYLLYYAPYPGAETVAFLDVGDLTILSADLPPGLAFYVAIRAYSESEISGFSNIEAIIIPSAR